MQPLPFPDLSNKEVSRYSINQFLNSGKPINKSNETTPTKNNANRSSINKTYSPFNEMKLQPVSERESIVGEGNNDLVEFKEIPSTIIEEEKIRFEEEESKNVNDDKKTTFIKRFGFEKGERLIDSFVCAVAKKILLQGRIYITNQRLCFHSFFNNKLLFFGKDTKITIPLEDIMSLEKRVNAIFFDNSIAVITKDEKETFFTSFIQRDKCFELIKSLLEDENSNSASNLNNNLLKRTFVRMQQDKKEGSDNGEGEDEEEEEEGDQGNYNEEPAQVNLSGEKENERHFDPDLKIEINDQNIQILTDLKNPENIK